MAFGFKFGGDKSLATKLLSGKLSEQEKQQTLQQLIQSNPSAADLAPLTMSDDASITQKIIPMFTQKADADAIEGLVNEVINNEGPHLNAAAVVKKCANEPTRQAVEAVLGGVNPATLKPIWEFILELQPQVSDQYLERAIQEAPGNSRAIALRRLVKAKGAEANRALLKEAASNKEVIVRKEALQALSTLQGEDIFTAMLDRLSSDDSKDVRDFAGKYLQQAIMQAPPDVRPKVLGRLLLAGEPEQRGALVKSMFAASKPDELLNGVLEFCKSLTGVQHRTLMDALKSVGEPLIQPTLAILKAPDADLRVQAVYLLEAFADPRTTNSLLQMLRDPDWWVRIVVCEAIGKMKDPRLVEPLRQVFADPDAKWAAIEAVSRLGGESAATALMPLLGDPVPEVRMATATALKNVKDPRVEKAVNEVAQKDASIEVRLKALEALREMRGGGADTGVAVQSKDLTKPLDKMLAYMRERNASDLHVTPGEPPLLRVNGILERLQSNKLEAEHAKAALYEILDSVRQPILEEHGAVDFCYAIPGVGRFRANVFKMKRGIAGVFRSIPNTPPQFAELGLPKSLAEIGTYHQGIVLVTGPAGSGKTTTMSALVNVINDSRAAHVLTFEDPVEFIHPSKKALINQREIGKDSMSYAAAMRGALREDPDIIVVGDMRDPETIRLALLASETGHLVVATMQTTGATATIDKLVESFPADEQMQVRGSLSESLKLIVSQVLVPRADGKGRVAVFEVLKSTSPVRSLIRDGKTFQLPSTMVIGRSVGMQTLDGALEEKVRAGQITFDVAYAYSQGKEQFIKLKGTIGGGAPAAGGGAAPAPGAAPTGKSGQNPAYRPPGAAGGPAPAASAPGVARPMAAPGAAPAARPNPAAAPGAGLPKKV